MSVQMKDVVENYEQRKAEREAESWLEDMVRKAKAGPFCVKRVVVTPALAVVLLKRNTENPRALRARRVTELCRLIDAGHWRANHQGLALCVDGTFADGQHRLHAVVKSGRSIVTDVHFGEDRDAVQLTVDIQMSRSPSVVLGTYGIKSGHIYTAALRVLLAWRGGIASNSNVRVTSSEVMAFIKDEPEVADAVSRVVRLNHHVRVAPGPVAAALHLIGEVAQADDIERFLDLMSSGVGLQSEADPIARYRSKAMRRDCGQEVEAAALFIKTWNAWRQGRGVQQLGWRGAAEGLPEVAP